MEYSGTSLFNSQFLWTPNGLFKIAELVFGAGAWGPIAMSQAFNSGPFSFYLWATVSTWVLVLLSFLIEFFKKIKVPSNEEEKKRYEQPQLGDLTMNVIIAFIYIPAIVVYGVYTFRFNPNSTIGVFILIMACLTFILHALHASSVVTFSSINRHGWDTRGTWIWNTTLSTQQPMMQPNAQPPPSHAHPQQNVGPIGGYANTATTAPVQRNDEVYQDLDKV